MTALQFRFLLLAYGLLEIGGNWLPENYSPELAYQYAIEPPHIWLTEHPSVIFVAVAGLMVVIVSTYAGLFLFKRWARTLAIIITLVGVATAPFFGPQLASALAGTVFYASSVLWGAILAIAYFSPLSSRFGANNSFKPTPLRG